MYAYTCICCWEKLQEHGVGLTRYSLTMIWELAKIQAPLHKPRNNRDLVARPGFPKSGGLPKYDKDTHQRTSPIDRNSHIDLIQINSKPDFFQPCNEPKPL